MTALDDRTLLVLERDNQRGAAHDKPEGLAVVGDGPLRSLVGVVDNDGVDDAPGESVFLRLGWIR